MKTLQLMFLTLLSVFAPVGPVLATILALVVVDLITGLVVSRKAGIPVTSEGLKKSVLKLSLYLIAALLAFLVGNYLTGPLVPVLNIVSGLIGITELKSVLENLDLISGGSLMKVIISAIQKSVSNNLPGGE